MKYTIKKDQKTWWRNTAKDVAEIVGCTKSNIEHHFSYKKKEHEVINGFLITKNKNK